MMPECLRCGRLSTTLANGESGMSAGMGGGGADDLSFISLGNYRVLLLLLQIRQKMFKEELIGMNKTMSRGISSSGMIALL